MHVLAATFIAFNVSSKICRGQQKLLQCFATSHEMADILLQPDLLHLQVYDVSQPIYNALTPCSELEPAQGKDA